MLIILVAKIPALLLAVSSSMSLATNKARNHFLLSDSLQAIARTIIFSFLISDARICLHMLLFF